MSTGQLPKYARASRDTATQPSLPIKKARAQTFTHYKRNGTTTLFAALKVATGQVIEQCLPRYRAKELASVLDTI